LTYPSDFAGKRDVPGRRSFTGDTSSHVRVSILEKEPAPLARCAPETPEELQRIVTKLLEKSPDERYQGARDLELDLKRLPHTLNPGGEIESLVRAASPAGVESAEPHTSPIGEGVSSHAVSGSYTANSPGGAGT
jgi:hypothetical protein